MICVCFQFAFQTGEWNYDSLRCSLDKGTDWSLEDTKEEPSPVKGCFAEFFHEIDEVE